MQITRLARTYSRSVAVTLPDGGEGWIRHEACIEATYEPGEVVDLTAEYKNLEEIALSEVGRAISEEKAFLLEASKTKQNQADQAFPTHDVALSRMQKL